MYDNMALDNNRSVSPSNNASYRVVFECLMLVIS